MRTSTMPGVEGLEGEAVRACGKSWQLQRLTVHAGGLPLEVLVMRHLHHEAAGLVDNECLHQLSIQQDREALPC